ncbi:aminopeptidase [bacterium]|nr:aminopeptidase [bacterium]
MELASHFYTQGINIGLNPYLSIIPDTTAKNTVPINKLATFLSTMDAAIFLTQKSLSHTNFRRNACKRGTRIASLPGVTKAMLIRNLDGEYTQTIRLSRKIADILTIGRQGHLTTELGTDLKFSINRMKGVADTGMLHEPGRFVNLPFGEACVAPIANTINGTIILDGSFTQIGKINDVIKLSIKEGTAVRISGGSQVQHLRKMLKPFGSAARIIGEIGIGTSNKAIISGNILEDEKCLGTVHFAFGNNISFGGKNNANCHFNGVILKPTLTIDGKSILENGILNL